MAVISRHHEQEAEEPSWTDELGSIPLIATLILPLIIGVVVLLKCLLNSCCLRKSTTKEEMFGVEGRMTMISNSETGSIGNNNSPHHTSTFTSVTNHTHQFSSRTDSAGVSNNNTKVGTLAPAPTRSSSLDPSRLSIISDAVDGRVSLSHRHSSPTSDSYETLDLTDSLKRSTVHRQLPDLPQGHNPPRRSSSVLSHDGTSELYATVEEVPRASGTQSALHRASPEGSHLYSNIPDSSTTKPSTSRTQNLKSKNIPSSSTKSKSSEPHPSSDSETYGNSTHPYAKLKRPVVEHPYARVKTRAGSSEPGGDEAEETDTDNYDVAHPYAQITARPGRDRQQSSAPPLGSQNHTDESQSSTSGSANTSANPERPTHPNRGASVESEDSGGAQPVPPRRAGRQWRRSHPQGQPQPTNSTNDNQVHFSGDSQDSRGYTSISVREPLSNIRNQALPRRNYDSHYATVSDDSEEMYAAIEDPNDGNYMRIPGEDGRQFQTLPNFERREANSPLPPVPPPLSPLMAPPSEISPTTPSGGRDGGPSSTPSPAPPIYAQVSKKKKTKAPTTPSGSGTGTTILSSHSNTSVTSPADAGSQPILSLSTNTLPSASATSVKRRHHHHAAILDPNQGNDSDPSRRWSKADISYSEFDIIREPCFPSTSEQGSSGSGHKSTSGSSTVPKPKSKPIPHPQLDEDNYNVISDVRSSSRISKSSESRRPYQEDNYQEIDSAPHHPYQEIGARAHQGPADYYQEISEIKKNKKPKHRDNTYQTIRGKNGEGDDSDDEDDDQFYEKVKVKPTTSGSSLSSSHLQPISSSTNPNIKKHGYEKLKRKTDETTNMTRVEIVISDEDDDENEEGGSLYEQVKYPPYERLQESRDNLIDAESDNLYEDIGYSQLTKGRKGSGRKPEASSSGASAPPPLPPESPTVDLDQLYARVDKSRKKKRSESQVEALGIQPLDYDKDHSIEYI